jgi:RNA polymerase sigma-70 factor (ECF subfamily)
MHRHGDEAAGTRAPEYAGTGLRNGEGCVVAQVGGSRYGRTEAWRFPSKDEGAAVPSAAAAGDDVDLVASLRGMDDATFSWAVNHYQSSLVRVARRFVESEAAAEDVVQETWVAVVRGVASFEGRSSFKTWLFRILINRARTRGVQDRRSVPFSGTTAPELESELVGRASSPRQRPAGDGVPEGVTITACSSASVVPEEWVMSLEVDDRLESSLARLPRGQRCAIMLHDLLGWTTAESSAALGVSEGNLRVLLHRARSRVRADLVASSSASRAGAKWSS